MAAKQLRALTYVGLFHSKSEAEIAAIAGIPGLQRDLQAANAASREEKLVLALFCSGNHATLLRYFRLRRGLKRLLGME